MVEFEGSLIVLAVSLLVGGLSLHLGALVALKARNYVHSVVTAALGSFAWWLLGLAISDLNVSLGPLSSLLALVVWVGVLKYRYRAGWVRASLIGLFAWIASLFVLAMLAAFGIRGIETYGIP
jgi:hypothetical protein